MYESFYGFREKPFNLTPDPKYLYLSPRHAEAFAHLEFGLRERGGFILITGEVGTGKTTLARYFLSKLGPETRTAVVLYPALSAAELLHGILDDLHVLAQGDTLKALVDALHRFLLESRAAGRDVVLLIDEAQDLSPEVLEQVRLLSNLETDTEKLIQIVLMGQSELRDLLARHELRQLAQRVTARYHLAPLGLEETAAYVRHRLSVAGGEGKAGFTSDALRRVHGLSGGVPRLVNLVCDRALLAGYVKGTRTITAGMVAEAGAEVEVAQPSPVGRWRWPSACSPSRSPRGRRMRRRLSRPVRRPPSAHRSSLRPRGPPPPLAQLPRRRTRRARRSATRGSTRSCAPRHATTPTHRRSHAWARSGARPRLCVPPCARSSRSCAASTCRPCSSCSTPRAATPASSRSPGWGPPVPRSWRPARR